MGTPPPPPAITISPATLEPTADNEHIHHTLNHLKPKIAKELVSITYDQVCEPETSPVPLGVLVEYEVMSWSPTPSTAKTRRTAHRLGE